MCTAVFIGWDPATPPILPHWDSYKRALLVSKDRRHIFVTLWGERTRSQFWRQGPRACFFQFLLLQWQYPVKVMELDPNWYTVMIPGLYENFIHQTFGNLCAFFLAGNLSLYWLLRIRGGKSGGVQGNWPPPPLHQPALGDQGTEI